MNLQAIGKDLFNKIRGRFPGVTIGDSTGKITNKPEDARFFDFEFKEGGNVLGKVSISISEEDGSATWMYESDDINQYLEKRFG